MARIVVEGLIAVQWLTSLPSDPDAPTQAELTAGTALVGTSQAEELVEIRGFEIQTSTLPTPGYASNVVGNVSGEQSYPDSTLSFYWDDTTQTIYTALAPGNSGWVYIAFDGLGSGNEALGFPATVASRVRRPARNAPHIFDVNFAVSAPYNATQAA